MKMFCVCLVLILTVGLALASDSRLVGGEGREEWHHLSPSLNSCCLDAVDEMKEKGRSVFKNGWDVTEKVINATLKATKWEQSDRANISVVLTNEKGIEDEQT